MIKRILLAYDGSKPADKAYAFAVDLAKKYAASIYVLAVARPPDFGDDVETEAILENSVKHYESLFAPLKDQAAAQGLNPRFEVVVGHPAEQIIYRAEEHNADLIVMGHRGKTLFERLRLGSVSKHVIHYAHCAVTVVR
ncbi:MAG TPA: universal stress protein [Burkholderiales bacterium]|nr:universal stress protein [Burkholderiales bacterium]